MESSKQASLENQLNHHMKLKRIWTYTQSPQSYEQKNSNGSQQQQHAKALTQVESKKITKKSHFISSLISKIKNVERRTGKSPSRDYIQKKLEYKNSQQQKPSKGIEHQIANASQNKLIKKKIIKNESQINQIGQNFQTKKNELEELRQQNFILKTKMSEIIVQNQKLKIKFKKYSQQLQERCSKIQIKEQELKMKQECLIQKQEIAYLQNLKTIEQQEQPKFLSIVPQYEEVVFPVQNGELLKAFQEIKQLKLDKLDLQKKYQQSLNQFRKNKQKDFQKMKKGFANNLKYYKELLLKVSLKSSPEIKKYQEDTFQTAILQISSAEQS